MRILGMAERLGEFQIRMMQEKGIGTLAKAAGLAGELAVETREYQEWLEDQISQVEE